MPSFNSEHPNAPEPVDFDFTEFGVDARGLIPEPSGEQISEFLDAMEKIRAEGRDKDGQPRVMTRTQLAARSRKVDAAVAALCSGTPTAKEIGQLKAAPRMAFIDFVQECFLDPGARAVGTSGSRSTGGDSGTSSAETSATP